MRDQDKNEDRVLKLKLKLKLDSRFCVDLSFRTNVRLSLDSLLSTHWNDAEISRSKAEQFPQPKERRLGAETKLIHAGIEDDRDESSRHFLARDDEENGNE